MSRRHDIQDATGIIEQYLPLGRIQSWRDSSGTSPTNGVKGHAPGAFWQDLINGKSYTNIGSFTSSLWVENDGGSGSSLQFGSAQSGFMLEAGTLYRNASGSGLAPAAAGAKKCVDLFSLPANSLDGTGFRGIQITAGGNVSGSTNCTATINVGATTPTVGGTVSTGTDIATTGTMSSAGAGWLLSAQIYKYGVANSNTQIYQETGTIVGTTHGGVGQAATLTLTENAAIPIIITINATTTAANCTLWWWNVEGFN